MILFAKEMQRRTEHTKASRAERRPAFTRSNQWDSSTRYEPRGERPVTNPRRNAERKAWTVPQQTPMQSPYQAPRHGGPLGENPMFVSPGSASGAEGSNRGFRKGQWGGSPVVTQPNMGGRVPGNDFEPLVEEKRRGAQIQATKPAHSTPQMTEHRPYKGFVLDPRLSEMSVKPGGWVSPKETSQGFKIPTRNKRVVAGENHSTSPVGGNASQSQGAKYPWREAPQAPLGSRTTGLSVEEELAQKRARTRAFLPVNETSTERRVAQTGATHKVHETNERVRPNEGVRPAGLAEDGHFIPPRKELVG